MDKKEKIKHLENIKVQIKIMSVNMANINKLSKMIKSELKNEESSEKPNRIYISNLKQTIEKQLDILIKSNKKETNRKDEFKDVVNNFNMDINRYLGDLRQNQ